MNFFNLYETSMLHYRWSILLWIFQAMELKVTNRRFGEEWGMQPRSMVVTIQKTILREVGGSGCGSGWGQAQTAVEEQVCGNHICMLLCDNFKVSAVILKTLSNWWKVLEMKGGYRSFNKTGITGKGGWSGGGGGGTQTERAGEERQTHT